jgi:hypothetical protein
MRHLSEWRAASILAPREARLASEIVEGIVRIFGGKRTAERYKEHERCNLIFVVLEVSSKPAPFDEPNSEEWSSRALRQVKIILLTVLAKSQSRRNE